MKKNIIKLVSGTIICASVILVAIAIWAMTHWGAIYYSSGFLGNTGNSEVWFTPNQKTTSSSGYNLAPNKNVKRCWTHLKSTSGDDTGRLYSDTAYSVNESSLYMVKGQIGRSPFYVVTHTWGWDYF